MAKKTRMVRKILIATTSMLLALTVATLGTPLAGGAQTSPALVSTSSWTNANVAAGSGQSVLQAVTCATASFCVAVGAQNGDTGGGLLIEQWNGTAWSVVPGATVTPSGDDVLNGVSCAGQDFCMTVGSTGTGAFAEMWKGSTWTATTVTPPPGFNGFVNLSTVFCFAANSCQALGTGFTGSAPTVFGEQWNGSTWSAVPAATPTAFSTETGVTGMACVSASYCIAVGNVDGRTSFAEQWTGSAWSLADSGINSNLPSGSFLAAVSCAGTSFCQAVGQVAETTTQNLIETWNGATWSVQNGTPQTSTSVPQSLVGVDCVSATSCSAVGVSGTASAALALTWNGAAWSIVSNTPNDPGTETRLAAETCLTDWACVAVGFQTTAGPSNSAFAMSAPIVRSGYRFVATDGGVFCYGAGAPFLGSAGGLVLNKPLVGMGIMPAGDGYDLVAGDGGIFNYGSAQFYGSTGSHDAQQAGRRHGGDPRRGGLLAGRVRRRHLQLRGRHLLRLDGQPIA